MRYKRRQMDALKADQVNLEGNRFAVPIWALLTVSLVCGCETVSNPWAGTAYHPPSANDGRGQIIYSPTPEILPSQKIESFNAIENDADLERTLFGSQ